MDIAAVGQQAPTRQTSDRRTAVPGERPAGAGFLVAGFHGPHGWMDPFLNVDHFVMSEPTFRPHPHAGFSAVTVMFEDSPGSFRNRDSLGSDLVLPPGSIHWTRAGSGIQHEEVPTIPGVPCHGAQIFVALPPDLETAEPSILHAGPADVPEVIAPSGDRIRVLAGRLGDAVGLDPGHDVVLLDLTVAPGSSVTLEPGADQTCFVVAVDGHGRVDDQALPDHHAVGVEPGWGSVVVAADDVPLHVLVGGGTPLRRPDHWIGGIAMSTPERSAAAAERYRRGEFGALAPSF